MPSRDQWDTNAAEVAVMYKGRIVLTAVVTALSAGALAQAAVVIPPGVVYAGETTQKEVVTVEVNPARTSVVRLKFTWTANCVPGPAATPQTSTFTVWEETRGGYPINKLGVWRKTQTANRVEGAVNQEFTYLFSGRRSGGNMVGTFKAGLTEKDPAGQIVRTCDSGPIKYSIADRALYGGQIVGEGSAMFVRTNPARTQVLKVRWDWVADCVAGPGVRPDTSLETFQSDFVDTPIAIKPNGSFTRSVSYDPFAVEGGIARAFSNKVVGIKIKQAIRGTLSARFVDTDMTTGLVIRTCTSKPLKFASKD